MSSMILDALCRRSAEDPKVPLTFDELADLGGSKATSGVKVSADKALKYSPIWRAVTLIAGDVARIPLFLYERQDGGKERAARHPAYRLLRYKPNTEMTAGVFKLTIQAHALLRGNGYAYIFRDGSGDVSEMIPLDPARTYPVRENGVLWYVYDSDDPRIGLRKLDPSMVFHLKGLGYDGLTGYSVISYAADAVGLGLAAHQYTSVYFKNSARPSVILEHPATLTEPAQKRLKEGWNKQYMGVDSAHKTAVLEEGMKAHVLSFNARDTQLIETLGFSRKDIANFFGLPPHKLGDGDRTSYNSLEMENQSYLDEALDPWLTRWEEECWDKLLREREKEADSHVVEFKRQVLVRANLQARAIYYRQALAGAPWMTIDEVRGLENQNAAGESDLRFPTNNFGDRSASRSGGAGAVDRAVDAARQALDKAKGDMRKRLALARKKAMERRRLASFLETVEAEHAGVIRAHVGPPATVVEVLTQEDNVCERCIAELLAEVKEEAA